MFDSLPALLTKYRAAPRAIPRSSLISLEKAHPRLLHRPVHLRILPHSTSIPRPSKHKAPRRARQGNLPRNIRQVPSLRPRQSPVRDHLRSMGADPKRGLYPIRCASQAVVPYWRFAVAMGSSPIQRRDLALHCICPELYRHSAGSIDAYPRVQYLCFGREIRLQ